MLYLVGIPYTLVQIIGWYVVNQPASLGDLTVAGATDKVAQVLLTSNRRARCTSPEVILIQSVLHRKDVI